VLNFKKKKEKKQNPMEIKGKVLIRRVVPRKKRLLRECLTLESYILPYLLMGHGL